MIVEEIEWISEPEDREAFVLIASGDIKVWAFAHPCKLAEGDEITTPLSGLDCTSVIAPENSNDFASLTGLQAKSYILAGTIVSVRPDKILDVGGIRITLDNLPGDIAVGDRVVTRCIRIDV